METSIQQLDADGLRRGVAHLAGIDSGLGDVVKRHGPPPMWARRPGIASLVRIILEQQVSLESGAAAYRRLKHHLGRVTADSILECDVPGLKQLGLTRQKAGYCLDVAGKIRSGELNLWRVARAPEQDARLELERVKGVGPWTADVYLLMALRRPDIWPRGDLALLSALQRLRGSPQRPTTEDAEAQALLWSPWRGVAARILWHGYLEGSLAPTRPAPDRKA